MWLSSGATKTMPRNEGLVLKRMKDLLARGGELEGGYTGISSNSSSALSQAL